MKDKVTIYNDEFENLKNTFEVCIQSMIQEFNDILDSNSCPSETDKTRLNQIDEMISSWNNRVSKAFRMYNSLVKEGVNDLPSPEDYFINKERK